MQICNSLSIIAHGEGYIWGILLYWQKEGSNSFNVPELFKAWQNSEK